MYTQQNLTKDTIEASYNELFETITGRSQEVSAIRSFLEQQTNWLKAPASTRYHLNTEKGLLIHSVGVTINALRIKQLLAPDITDESVTIVALFHDAGKVGYAGKPYYLPNDNEYEKRRGINYKVNPDITHMSHAVRSLHLVSRFITLTEEEAQAIVAHDGLYPLHGGVNNLDYHHRECRLQMLLHFADKWTAAVNEEQRK
jgi:23S rRNA maturation-related 3'-5' exoribonuclease YhaM